MLVENSGPSHPHNFSACRKVYIAFAVGLSMFSSTISSSLPGGVAPYVSSHFHVIHPVSEKLPSTMYLVGYIVGPLVFAPLSEHFGRRPILLLTSGLFTSMSIGCTLAPTFAWLLTFRFLAGAGGSAPISIIGGVYADIFPDPTIRGRATAAYTVLTTLGTVLGPTICGYIALHNWRWTFGMTSILGFLSFILMLFSPETYVPRLQELQDRQRQSVQGNSASFEAETNTLRSIIHGLTVGIGRPLRFFMSEYIVFFTSLYCALVFAILFLFFAAYPSMFQSVYGMSHETSGLAYIPMAVGTVLAYAIYVAFDKFREMSLAGGAEWAAKEEFRRLPMACGGGIVLVISLFWLAWTAKKSVHWIVPMLSGVPFGISFNIILMVLFNYLTDSYGRHSASALAAASCARSVAGALLPLVQSPMYRNLGFGWATSVIGFASVALVPVPFVFIIYGSQLRARSRFCENNPSYRDEQMEIGLGRAEGTSAETVETR